MCRLEAKTEAAEPGVVSRSGTGGGQLPAISVVMPAYQEAATIVEAVTRVQQRLSGAFDAVEIIVVSDGSSDGTADFVRESNLAGVRALHYWPNRGKGFAVRHGVADCTHELVALLDADLDIDPVSLVWLTDELIIAGVAAAVAAKSHPASEVAYPWTRRLLSRGYRLFVGCLFRLHVAETQTGAKVFRRQALAEALEGVTTDGFAFDVDLLANLRRRGYEVVSGPVRINFQYSAHVPVKTVFTMTRDTLRLAARHHTRRTRGGHLTSTVSTG